MNATVKEHNSHVCPSRFSFMLDNFVRRMFQRPEKIVGEYIRQGDTIVDLGCGPGFFTIDMAKLAGPSGKVYAVDLQTAMLEKVEKKAERRNLSDRIVCHQCSEDQIGLGIKADFILAFYMVHEVPDAAAYLAQIRDMMKKDARLLVVEPKMHVSKESFDKMLSTAASQGLVLCGQPEKKGGFSALFRKDG